MTGERGEARDHDLAAAGESYDQVFAVNRDLSDGRIEIDDEALTEFGLDQDDLARLGLDQAEGIEHARDDPNGVMDELWRRRLRHSHPNECNLPGLRQRPKEER